MKDRGDELQIERDGKPDHQGGYVEPITKQKPAPAREVELEREKTGPNTL